MTVTEPQKRRRRRENKAKRLRKTSRVPIRRFKRTQDFAVLSIYGQTTGKLWGKAKVPIPFRGETDPITVPAMESGAFQIEVAFPDGSVVRPKSPNVAAVTGDTLMLNLATMFEYVNR